MVQLFEKLHHLKMTSCHCTIDGEGELCHVTRYRETDGATFGKVAPSPSNGTKCCPKNDMRYRETDGRVTGVAVETIDTAQKKL